MERSSFSGGSPPRCLRLYVKSRGCVSALLPLPVAVEESYLRLRDGGGGRRRSVPADSECRRRRRRGGEE